MSGTISSPPPGVHGAPPVVAINDAGALYLALAEAIHGAAVGMSPAAQTLLRQGLQERFGTLFEPRSDDAVDELLRLATADEAA